MKNKSFFILLFISKLALGQGVSTVPQFRFYIDSANHSPTSIERYLVKSSDFRFFLSNKFSYDKLPSRAIDSLCVKGEAYAKFEVNDLKISNIVLSQNTPKAIAEVFIYAIKESEKFWKTDKKLNVLLPIHYVLHNSCKYFSDIIEVQPANNGDIIFSDNSKKTKQSFDIIFEPHIWQNTYESWDVPIIRN